MHRLLQFTLDLFESASPASTPVRKARRPQPPAGRRPARATGTATPDPAVLLPLPFEPGQGAPTLRHPKSNREALLCETVVAYELRRARRRNIGFTVGPEGLTVSAPKWVPLAEVDAAVKSKSSWILRKLGEAGERRQRIESARIEWRDGAAFPFMGEQVVVVLDPRHGFDAVGAMLDAGAGALPGAARPTLRVSLSHTASADQIRDAVQAWLKRQARRVFEERLNHYAPQLGVRWTRMALSSAGTRWGTAHSDGSIRLNWRLIHFRLPVIDYVVAHELSHLRVMNHSPRFWDTVRTVVPDYAHLRGQLKEEALPVW